MTPHISCPSCTRSLGRIQPDGSLLADCPRCHQRFGVIYGKLSGWLSRREAMLYLSPQFPSFYKRRYEFRITTPERSLKVLKFSIPGREDQVPVRPGDRISILYAPQGRQLKNLISIYNHTIGRSYQLPSPLPSPTQLSMKQGILAIVLTLVAAISGLSWWWVPGMGAIAFFLYDRLVDVADLTTPELQTNHPLEARLLNERHLMDQKLVLERRIRTTQQETHSHQELIRQLLALRSKMLAVNTSLYASRVGRIESAVRLLKHRIHHDERLMAQYQQAITMIEIELEAAYLDDHLLEIENFNSIFRKLDELKRMEDENQNLWMQLEANEEVRRLSFGS